MPDTTTQGAPAGAAESGQTAVLEQMQAGVAHPQNDGTQDAGDQQHESAEGREALTPEQREQRKSQRRIERLAAQRTEARTEAQMLRARLAELEARPQTQDAGNDKQQSPNDIDALANERAADLLDRKQTADKLKVVLEKGRKLEGFGTAVDALHDEVPIMERGGRPTAFLSAILDSDDPAALVHYLGTNPDEAAEYRGLSPVQIGRRLAKLEDRLKRDAKQQTSNAPVPLNKVTPKSAPSKSLLDLSADEYAKARRKQLQGS